MQLNLDLWKCDHQEAKDGSTALKILRESVDNNKPYDIAIIDMLIPNMDGETLGKKIKADSHLKDTILVMMASIGRRGDATRLKDLGFAGYLSKPAKQNQIYKCLLKVLNEKPIEGTTASEIVTKYSLAEKTIQVLVAEDNIGNQKVITKMLEKRGCKVHCVTNGKEAVIAVKELPFNLVLMDCQMPEMDGFEATKLIKNPDEKYGNIPIIALTAGAMKEDYDRCMASGMDDYLSKPVQMQKLEKMIDKWYRPNK